MLTKRLSPGDTPTFLLMQQDMLSWYERQACSCGVLFDLQGGGRFTLLRNTMLFSGRWSHPQDINGMLTLSTIS